jgi:siroheme synthase-like protein
MRSWLRDLIPSRNGNSDPTYRLQKMLKRWRRGGRDWPSRLYYPAILDIAGRRALVVGAGFIAEGKIEGLLNAGAKVKVVSLTATDTIKSWAAQGKIALDLRAYEQSDLDGCFMVIAATENNQTNVAVYEHAEARQMLCNVVDVTDLCNFILPSIVRHGDLRIAVSTGGASPAMARRIRIALSQCYGEEYAVALKILGSLREQLKARYPDFADRKIVFERMVYSNFMGMVRNGDVEGLEAWIETCISDGPGYVDPARHREMIEAADPECKLRFAPLQIENAPVSSG